MDTLQDIIQRCYNRHKRPLQQKKTVITPAVYRGQYQYHHFSVYCAYKQPVKLHDLEQADISFMPIGRAPYHDRMPHDFGGERFLQRQRMRDWQLRQWRTSWGIRVYTGPPSERDDARWHDLHFTYRSLCIAPDEIIACLETLINAVPNPLLTITKVCGLRFSCRVPNYLHPNTETDQLSICKNTVTSENQYQRDMLLEIYGDKGHSPWDARYEIVCGDLLDPPIVVKEVLFTAVNELRSALNASGLETLPTRGRDLEIALTEDVSGLETPPTRDVILSPPSFGSQKLDLAKEAFLKRGYFYLRQENDLHHWAQNTTVGATSRSQSEGLDTDVLLWERGDTVWIRALTPDFELPTQDTPITDVWDDTGILPPLPDAGIPVSKKVVAVQEGKLSPLAIKHAKPVLQKPEKTEGITTDAREKIITQVQDIFESDARIVGLIVDTDGRHNYETVLPLLKNGAVSYNAEFHAAAEASRYFEKQDLPSIVHRRGYGYRSNPIKDIPIQTRMAKPFERGNVCEDAERTVALKNRDMDPTQIICPQCPVNTTCNERGYLSQFAKSRSAEVQISGKPDVFYNPESAALVDKFHHPIHNTERLCIIDKMEIEELFLMCNLSKDTLEQWHNSWCGETLGNFAQALLNVLQSKAEPDNSVIKRVRTVVQSFALYEADLIEQMCRVNLKGEIVEQGFIDDETGAELARFMIMFEGGVVVYIPIDSAANDRLKAKGIPTFQPDSFEIDTDVSIPMPITEAIHLGILDASTPEKIMELPTVNMNPDWTFWHRLKRFFSHYTRDTDAPMAWYDDVLTFWVPPVLHPNVKRLLFMSTSFFAQHIRRIFPHEEIEVMRMKHTPWIAGNQLFQIRTSIHSSNALLDLDNTWDVISLSKASIRFFLGICAEIDRDPNVMHAVITYSPIISHLQYLKERENVCSLRNFKGLHTGHAIEKAEVVWIVGTPYWAPGGIWQSARILYGNDEEPLCYEADADFQHYKDTRVQRVYTHDMANLIKWFIRRVGLTCWQNKKVVLINSFEIPDITNRPETMLFDWEDFEVAGGLHKLAETIATRERYENARDNLTAETPREEVERVLGCSSRQANRVLQQLRGGNIPRVTFREQILSLLADGEKKSAEVIAVIDGNPHAINRELVRLTKTGEIVKARRGVYNLSKNVSS